MNINKLNVLKLSLELTQVNMILVELTVFCQPGALFNTLVYFILHMQLLTLYRSFYPFKAPPFNSATGS